MKIVCAFAGRPILIAANHSKRRLSLLTLGCAALLTLILAGPTLWRYFAYSRTLTIFDGNLERVTTHRFTGAFETNVWDIDTGFLVTECFESHEDEIERLSGWTRDGIVSSQEWYEPGIHLTKEEPPWWWGVTDQAEPSAPWIATGETFDEWWERVRPR